MKEMRKALTIIGALALSMLSMVGADTVAERTAGEAFRDCPNCPEMVVIPAGSFRMGCLSDDDDCDYDEKPAHGVRIAAPFALGRHEVTFAEWDACVAADGCGGYRPADGGWGRGNRPAINVNWEDARSYARWLSDQTGHGYRLPSESEWEYAARAGTATKYWWGDENRDEPCELLRGPMR